MRDSGVPWIGSIPRAWSVEPFRRLFRESKEVNGPAPVGPMLSISGYRGVEEKVYESASLIRDNDQLESYRVVRPGQLAVNTMWLNYSGLGVSDLLGHVSPAYRAYWISDRLDGRFTHYLMRSSIYVQGYTALLTGIRPNSLQMSRPDLMAFPVLVPPIAEQRAIASYLDRETAHIDAFIAKNEELISLLTERRAALVPDRIAGLAGSMRGEKLGYSCRLGNGSTPRREEPRYWEGGEFPWLNSSVVNLDRVRSADQFVTDAARVECHLPMVKPGAIVVGLTGEGRTRGMATIVDIEATISQHLGYIQPDLRQWDPEYLVWLIRSRYMWLRDMSDANGATKGGLTVELLRSMRVDRPALSEQRRLAEDIASQTARISTAVHIAARGVQLARERRAALISAAVTGKIEVGVAA